MTAADPDGPIRRVPLLVLAGGVTRPGLARSSLVRLAQSAGALLIEPGGMLHVGDIVVPLGSDATLRLTGSPTVHTIPAATLIDRPDARAMLANHIVLIGSSAPELGGLRVTSTSPATPSVLIQAEAVEALLRGGVPVRPAWAELAEPLGALVLGLVCLLLAVHLRPAVAVSLAILSCLTWAGAAVAAVPAGQLLVDPAGPPIVAIFAFAATMVARFVRDEWRARVLRLSFEQHLAPEVVRRIAGGSQGTAPARRDARNHRATRRHRRFHQHDRGVPNYTDLVALLDAYFEVTTRIVTDHGGMIDKIVGDSIHAIYNAPFALPDHAGRAVASALALLAASEEVRQSCRLASGCVEAWPDAHQGSRRGRRSLAMWVAAEARRYLHRPWQRDELRGAAGGREQGAVQSICI